MAASVASVVTVLSVPGLLMAAGSSGPGRPRQRDVASRTLVTAVAAGSGRRWLLVGQRGELGVVSQQVTVADYGRSSAGELLRVEEYDAQG